MTDIWNAIKLKLNEIAPEILNNLFPGVTDIEVWNLEKLIKAKLPIDFINFYKIHNGQKTKSAALIEREELLSFERIETQWKAWASLLDSKILEEKNNYYSSITSDNGVKKEWWNFLWIPITYDGNGNHFCLDLSPTKKGRYGQIIRVWHDDCEREVVANSFKEWITDYKDKLINGQFVYSEDYFGIVNKDWI